VHDVLAGEGDVAPDLHQDLDEARELAGQLGVDLRHRRGLETPGELVVGGLPEVHVVIDPDQLALE
jgi:hypothetical protein